MSLSGAVGEPIISAEAKKVAGILGSCVASPRMTIRDYILPEDDE